METAGAIFAVAVQSDVPLDLQESQVAILSRSPPDAANGSATLATYRCRPRDSRSAPSGIGTPQLKSTARCLACKLVGAMQGLVV